MAARSAASKVVSAPLLTSISYSDFSARGSPSWGSGMNGLSVKRNKSESESEGESEEVGSVLRFFLLVTGWVLDILLRAWTNRTEDEPNRGWIWTDLKCGFKRRRTYRGGVLRTIKLGNIRRLEILWTVV